MSKLLQLALQAAKSKTILWNGSWLAVIVTVLTSLKDSDFIQSNPEWGVIIAGVIAAINIILRTVTTVPISQK